MKKSRKTVFVAMSGGVDSSVAALLLAQQGYNVVGVFMRCFNIDGCAEHDAEDARRVAEHLKIPFYVWDLEEEYKQRVVRYMVEGYRQGLTPNPDVMCNKEIKFGLFLKKALERGADYIATGHYAKIRRPLRLFTAKDKNKDQSYFLWTLTERQVGRCLFPIGDYLKSEVRTIARRAGLLTSDKKDSQGICFLGKVTLADFLAQYIPEKEGVVVTTAGEKIGEHRGAQFYTIGQRHIGVNLRLSRGGGEHAPYYVAEKDIRTNTVVVAEGDTHPALYKSEVALTDLNFVRPTAARARGINVFARVRYRQPLFEATFSSSDTKGKLVFATPQKFVAPGQSAVLYLRSGEVLGGGVVA